MSLAYSDTQVEHYLQVEMNNAPARSKGAHTRFFTIIQSRVVNHSNDLVCCTSSPAYFVGYQVKKSKIGLELKISHYEMHSYA